MKNDWQGLADNALYNVATQAYTIINANLIAYGCNAAQMTALTNGKTALSTSITSWETKRAALEAETQNKLAQRQATINALVSVANTIYANAAVTDTMLANAGYAIHDKIKTHIVPQTVGGLTVTADGSGNAFLKWARGGNTYGVIFVIEQSADGLSWSQVYTTTKVKATISGLTVGEAVWFRVRATKNNVAALPSDPVSLWNPNGGEQVQLQVAA